MTMPVLSAAALCAVLAVSAAFAQAQAPKNDAARVAKAKSYHQQKHTAGQCGMIAGESKQGCAKRIHAQKVRHYTTQGTAQAYPKQQMFCGQQCSGGQCPMQEKLQHHQCK